MLAMHLRCLCEMLCTSALLHILESHDTAMKPSINTWSCSPFSWALLTLFALLRKRQQVLAVFVAYNKYGNGTNGHYHPVF